MADTDFGANYTYGDNGVVIPDTADIQTAVQTEFQTALGSDLSLEESTPQGRLIDVETTARANTIAFNAQITNVLINIATAAGTALDAWGANFDISRNGATASTVAVTVTGIADTVIPAGSQASTDDGIIWQAESEIIIDEDGTAEGTFICSTTGPVELGIGELNTIIASTTTGIDGWETITNTAIASVGSNIESDTSYKTRILNSIFSGTALFGNYASVCYKVDGVNDVFTYDNPYGTALTLDNIDIPAHSVFVCVAGGNSEDIAKALYSVKSAGCGWCGNTTVTITDETYNTKNTVTFYVPDSVDLTIEVDVTSETTSNADLTATIQDTIINYFNGDYEEDGFSAPKIRGLISPFTIASLLNTEIYGISVTKVQAGLVTPTAHAIASIIKASVTSGIIWASVDSDTFASQVSENGTYNFTYNGSEWLLNSESVTLSDYGISVTSDNDDPVTGDIISVIYSNGELSQYPIKLFCTETPAIAADNITVNING
ncbi:MAG: baseplate J/gp47 family protein [Tannerellaceae bacterium]|nr:baseplate J/gp47 family protein [Tannerellaceae bacterium]